MLNKAIVLNGAAVILLAAAVTRVGAGAGTSGADFLQLLADPQSGAMGDSVVYAPPSAAVLLANPAGMSALYQPKFTLVNMMVADGVDYRFAGLVVPGKSMVFGMGAAYVTYGDIPSYDVAGTRLGTVSPKDMAWIIGCALPLRHDYPVTEDYGSIGASCKVIQSSLADRNAQAVAFDCGATVLVPGLEHVSVGLAAKNMGGSLTYVKTSAPLPGTIGFGIKYQAPAWNDFTLTADLSRTMQEGITGLGAGCSFSPVYPVTLRAGFKQTADNMLSGLRGGMGLDFNDFSLNYAVIPARDFALAHQMSLDIAFGKIARPDIAYNYYLNYHFEIAKDKFKKKDYLAARQELEEILSLYPDHQQSKEYLVKIGQALDELEQQRMIGITRWLSRARTAYARNDLHKARRYYNYVLGVEPENAEAVAGLERIDGTVKKVRQDVAAGDKRPLLTKLWDQSVLLYRNGSYVEAKESFKQYLAQNPNSPEARRYMKEIDAQLEKISSIQIDDLFFKGLDLYDVGKFREALKYFNAVITAVPSRTDAQDYADRCQKAIRDEESRASTAQQALGKERIREQIEGVYAKALTQYQRGEVDDALKMFSSAREMAMKNPGNEKTAQNARNYIATIKSEQSDKQFKAGFEQFQANKLEPAAAAYRRSLELNPENTSAKVELERVSATLAQQYYELGMKAFTAGDRDRARENFKKSLSYQPSKAEAQRALERIQ